MGEPDAAIPPVRFDEGGRSSNRAAATSTLRMVKISFCCPICLSSGIGISAPVSTLAVARYSLTAVDKIAIRFSTASFNIPLFLRNRWLITGMMQNSGGLPLRLALFPVAQLLFELDHIS